MPLPFDATLKELVQTYAADWLALLHESPSGPVKILTPDLSTVTAFTDIVLHMGDALLHLDFQSGPDSALPRRVLLYNVLLYDGYQLPVHSVVILLRPRADRGDLTNSVSYAARPGRGGLDFRFEIIRLWQVPVEQLLTSGLGTLPLAVLGQLPEGRTRDEALAEVIGRLVQRIDAEASAEQGPILLTASFVLTGMRVSRQRVLELFQGVRKMRESTSYQAILDEGRAEGLVMGEIKGRAEGRVQGMSEGRAEEAQQLLLRLGQKKFGPPDAAVAQTVRGLGDVERLESLIERLLEVASWHELLRTTS
jgi:predicted transposase YdaD